MPFLNATKPRCMLTAPFTPLDSAFNPTQMQSFFDSPKKIAFTKEIERTSDASWVFVEFASPFPVGSDQRLRGWYRNNGEWSITTK